MSNVNTYSQLTQKCTIQLAQLLYMVSKVAHSQCKWLVSFNERRATAKGPRDKPCWQICTMLHEVWELEMFQITKVTFKVISRALAGYMLGSMKGMSRGTEGQPCHECNTLVNCPAERQTSLQQ